jgi:mannose-6-phosphate isomerase-like protein (cupin superfamily)
MTITTKQDLILASKQRKIHIERNFLPNYPSWSGIDRMYELDSDVIYNGFGSFQLQDMSVITQGYKELLTSLYEIHNGRPMFGMTIVHFVTKNNNVINDPDFLSLRNKFYKENPVKIPEHMNIKDYGFEGESIDSWSPKVHFDAQERFYVQGCGQTLWRLFDESKNLIDAIVVNPGDLAYIPKGVFHSVESIGPRHSISLAFSDDPEIAQA